MLTVWGVLLLIILRHRLPVVVWAAAGPRNMLLFTFYLFLSLVSFYLDLWCGAPGRFAGRMCSIMQCHNLLGWLHVDHDHVLGNLQVQRKSCLMPLACKDQALPMTSHNIVFSSIARPDVWCKSGPVSLSKPR